MSTRTDRLSLLCLGLVTVLSVPLVLGFLGDVHPAFDSLAHFRAHLAVVTGLAALALLAAPGFRLTGLAGAALAIGAFTTTTLPAAGMSSIAGPADPDGAHYRLLQFNLRYDNATPDKVFSLIGRNDPDVLMFNEVSTRWKERLQPLRARYPYGIICPRPTYIGGVAILSRRPLVADTEAVCRDRGAFAIARIDFNGRAVTVAALHLGWPWPYGQHRQIDQIAGDLAALPGPAVLAGDFNATPWSLTVKRVARLSEMRLAGRIGPTWLHHVLPALLRNIAGLPIDQVLAKGGIGVLGLERLEDAGSDHAPVLFTFALSPPEQPPAEAAVASAATPP